VAGDIYVFLSPDAGVSKTRFYIDNPAMSGTPFKTENGAPVDLGGTNSAGLAMPFDTTSLTNGSHQLSARIDLTAGGTEAVHTTFTVNNTGEPPPPPPPGDHNLMVSLAPNRSGAVNLEGQVVGDNIYVFTSPAADTKKVRFFVDDPGMNGTPFFIEKGAPFDLMGSTNNGATANPFDTLTLSEGVHNVTASLTLLDSTTEVISANFSVSNNQPSLSLDPSALSFTLNPDESDSAALNVTSSQGTPSFTVTKDAAWLTVAPTTGTTPRSLTATVNTAGLSPGSYAATITVAAAGFRPAVASVSLTVGSGGPGGPPCTPLACEQILIDLPYELNFASNHSKILDAAGVGTGFTYVMKPSKGVGYIPSKLHMNTAAGVLRVDTTAGLNSQGANTQDNALGVGIDAPSQNTLITTTLVNPPAGTGKFEQAGLYFGVDDDNYVKLVVSSTSKGTKIENLVEVNSNNADRNITGALNLSSSDVTLELHTNPAQRTVTGTYRIDGGPPQIVGSFAVPPEFFSFDGAGIDPRIGTRSFGGIIASHRNAVSPTTYTFEDFNVTQDGSPPPGGGGDLNFSRSSFPVPMPSAMVWGPDNRLYVAEAFGKIHALTYGANNTVTNDQVINTLGSRLTLGLTVDPASTPSNVILYASHSNPSFNGGQPNSGMVTRLSGAGFTTRADVITGLPRALANHATNSIHFGPDGKLYIAQGGNTGAGAHNTADTEFGDMREQPLSSAILVADIKAAGFDGSCHNATDIFGPPPCSVTTYATGMRNSYDLVWHSNGTMYSADNGLGVTGTFPPTPNAPCNGIANPAKWDQGGHNPGEQPDILNRVLPGKYYGHPNPSRNQCVFKNGSFQGVPAPANYEQPVLDLGKNRSANGTVEYTSDQFCGALQGEILIANYSVGDNITRTRLSADGTSVIGHDNLVGGFDDPLPLTMSPDGRLFVGEFGGNQVTVLQPENNGCWETKAPLPVNLLDAGGTALNGKLYVVAGKTTAGPQNTMYIYDPATNAWTTGASLPGAAVENPAVVAHGGKLYAFGGSTGPFGGAQTTSAVFDPATGNWTSRAAMPTARSGAAAQVVGSNIYVAGGMAGNGASVSAVEIYNPTTNSWSAAPSMGTRRDNPGSASIGGKLFVFGGRTREADGTVTNGTLNTVEMYDPSVGSWVARASMLTGRRTMVVGNINGRAQVMGGEITQQGDSFKVNEEYDPATDSWRALTPMLTGRHGAVAGTINGVTYVVGGGPVGGGTFTNVNEAFSF
jgi:glucose/arabinose dehydrogenase/N-acetylneuraminic acid mutarotase